MPRAKCVDDLLQSIVRTRHLHLDLRDKVHLVFGTPVTLRLSLLSAKAADFGDSHPVNAVFAQGIFDIVEFETADNGFYFFHE